MAQLCDRAPTPVNLPQIYLSSSDGISNNCDKPAIPANEHSSKFCERIEQRPNLAST